MAITYFNSASTPADNGTNTATTTSVTPPGSMLTGDLVVLISYQRGTSTTHNISNTGGQAWNTAFSSTASSSATLSAAMFWCTFNGTWSADPSVVFSAGTNTNVVMHVFRPSDTGKVWSEGTNVPFTPKAMLNQAAPSTPFDVSSGYTIDPDQSSAVILIGALSDDDNTWTMSSNPSTFTVAGSAQYRNTSGNDTSSVHTYKITNASATGPILRQATNGGDPGLTYYIIFYEDIPAASFDPFGMMGFFGM